MPIHHSCFKNPFEEKHQDVKWEDGFPYSNEYQDRFFQDDAVAEIKNIFINAFFLAITIGIIITSGGIGKNELSIKETSPK